MTSKSKKALIDSIYLVLAWYLTWLAVLVIDSHSPARHAYGLLSAWWCTLYVGYIRKVDTSSLLPATVIELCTTIIILAIGLGPLLGSKELRSLSDLTFDFYLLIIVVGTFLRFASSIFINIAVRYGISKAHERARGKN